MRCTRHARRWRRVSSPAAAWPTSAPASRSTSSRATAPTRRPASRSCAAPWKSRCSRSSPTRAKRSEEHTSELQSLTNLVCRLLLEKKKKKNHRRVPNNQDLEKQRPCVLADCKHIFHQLARAV